MKDETHSSALRMAMRLSSPSINKASPSVFLYSFEMPHHDSHSGDIRFLFDKDYYPRRKKMNDDELSMDKIYPTYIRMFVKTGQPSSDWKAFNSDQRNFMRITHVTYENGSIVEPQMQNAFYNDEAHLWLEQFANVERRALEINRSKQHSAKTFLADEIKADDIGEDSTDTPVLFWMGSFLITLVFVCLVITLTLLVLILYIRKFGYPSWLRNKVSDEHIEERYIFRFLKT
ncbi:unnamed protein product [Anisakis simplex]|uniref:COesterase domain-containing protein n=1 Tax=Anisakis simplex TaxID=6269 RepID=A0A0M3JAD1_ANISI|nr:unnamed protein product [Anisakis simplex]